MKISCINTVGAPSFKELQLLHLKDKGIGSEQLIVEARPRTGAEALDLGLGFFVSPTRELPVFEPSATLSFSVLLQSACWHKVTPSADRGPLKSETSAISAASITMTYQGSSQRTQRHMLRTAKQGQSKQHVNCHLCLSAAY